MSYIFTRVEPSQRGYLGPAPRQQPPPPPPPRYRSQVMYARWPDYIARKNAEIDNVFWYALPYIYEVMVYIYLLCSYLALSIKWLSSSPGRIWIIDKSGVRSQEGLLSLARPDPATPGNYTKFWTGKVGEGGGGWGVGTSGRYSYSDNKSVFFP